MELSYLGKALILRYKVLRCVIQIQVINLFVLPLSEVKGQSLRGWRSILRSKVRDSGAEGQSWGQRSITQGLKVNLEVKGQPLRGWRSILRSKVNHSGAEGQSWVDHLHVVRISSSFGLARINHELVCLCYLWVRSKAKDQPLRGWRSIRTFSSGLSRPTVGKKPPGGMATFSRLPIVVPFLVKNTCETGQTKQDNSQ